ncbi:MAG: hypothetical protein JNK82_43675 [Myxococcaceae bacterium]|nr:hypothetical protein [Myxococcaceae bacterium]
MKLALISLAVLLWSPAPRQQPVTEGATASGPRAIGDDAATKCKRKCNSKCDGANNKSKCVAECRRACDE